MVGGVPLDAGDVVVEFGPGTGPMTAALARAMPAGVRFVAIERDEGFCARLRARFPRLEFHHGSAEQVAQVLHARAWPHARLIVSGLPFAAMPAEVQQNIVVATRAALAADGVFRTFAYVHAYGSRAARRFRELMQAHFSRFARSGPVLWNMPPAYVLTFQP